MIADKNADYYNDPEGLATLLLQEAKEYELEQQTFDNNDSFYDYLSGLISARLTVVGRLGYAEYIKDYLPDWSDC